MHHEYDYTKLVIFRITFLPALTDFHTVEVKSHGAVNYFYTVINDIRINNDNKSCFAKDTEFDLWSLFSS